MKKRLTALALCMALFLLGSSALAGCAYFDANGDHNWAQFGFSYATCEEDGYYEIYCQNCGIIEKHTTDKKLGHKWELIGQKAATCDAKGYKEYECANCGKQKTESVKARSHDWEDMGLLEAASCTQEGSMRTRCSLCGETGTRTLAQKSHDYSAWSISVQATDHSKGERMRSCVTCGKEQREEFYPEGTLYRGGKNDKADTKELQQLLADAGYLRDKVDGAFGKNTEAAVKAFQGDNGLRADGIAWPQTIRALHSEPETEEVEPTIISLPTVSSAPAATAAPSEYPTYCERMFDEMGAEQLRLCEQHAQLQSLTTMGLTNLTNPAARKTALAQYRKLWSDEVTALYERWLSVAPQEDIPMVAQSKSIFALHLNEQEGTWKKLFGSNPEMVEQKVIEACIDQCVELCSIIALYEQPLG